MKFLVGVDIGGTNTKLGLMDAKGCFKDRGLLLTTRCKGSQALIRAIASEIKSLLKRNGLSKKDIIGVGIGAPGAVDSVHGVVHYLTNIPDWREVPLKKILEKKLRLPVFVDNDANVMALGELYYGSGRLARNIVCVTLGTGVGGGLIIERKLYRGSSLAAGELGHMPLNADGPRCNCGSKACLEAYVGSNYLVRSVTQKIKKGKATLITKLVKNRLSMITPEVVSRAARSGDRFAKEVFKKAGTDIGILLAGVINLLNPDTVVIGGGVAQAGGILINAIKRAVKTRAMLLPRKTVTIVQSKLGYDAGLIGAASLVVYELESRSKRAR